MKRTFVAAFAGLAMVMLVSGYAIAAPGQGKGPGGDVPEKAVAAQGQCACQGEVFGQGQDGVEGKTGCGCHQGCACANAEKDKGCQGGCGMAAEGKGCGCGMAGEGKGCQGGCAMAAEGKGCGCAMAAEGKGCGCGMGMGHGKGHHKGDHRFWKCPKARAELNLTEEQTKKLEELETADQGKIDVLQREIKDLKDRKHELMKAQPIDLSLVSEVVTKLGQTKTELMLIRTGMKAAALNVLTPEQRDKLFGMHGKMMAGKGGCHHGRDKDKDGDVDDDDLDDDLDKITCPKAMEERAAKMEKKAREHDQESKELKAKARELKAKAKKAKSGKGSGKKGAGKKGN